MATKAITQASFKETIEQGIVLIDFWAPWCGPCRVFGPTFEKLSEANPDVVFGKVNTEQERGLAAAFGIQAIPTLMALRDGIVVYQQAGALPGPVVQKLVDQIKALDMDKVRSELEEPAKAATA
jgi:thioredoxin 1